MSDTFNPLGVGKFGEKRRKRSNPVVQQAKIIKPNTSNETVIKTFSLKMLGADFKIDHKPRRKNKSSHRRALVHGFNDELMINWAKDYPGGVVINGNVKCPNTLEVGGHNVISLIKTMQLKIDALEKKLEDLSWNTEG